RQYREAKQGPGTNQLANEGHHHEDEAVAKAVTNTIQEAGQRRILHRIGFGPAHDDAVGDDQAHEHRQLFTDLIGIGLEDLIDHDHQGGDDGHLHDDPDVVGDVMADDRHEE